MKDIVTSLLLLAGTALMLLAAVGVLRMPDVYTRLSATSKAATLGVALILLGGASYFLHPTLSDRALATVAFFLLTAPVSAQMIARAAYRSGVAPDAITKWDDYRDAPHEDDVESSS